MTGEPLDDRVTIVIPTLGLAPRSVLLERAIASVLSQEGVAARPLVVLNGGRADPAVEQQLRDDPRIELVVREEPGLPAALQAGRERVETPWFGTLDDDDVLLPGALASRLEALRARPECAVIVTNGYVDTGRSSRLNTPAGVDVMADPLGQLLRGNWLLPGSWLARTAVVGPDVFAKMPRYTECTYLGAVFSTQHRMLWSPTPTVIYNVGSPLAESRSAAYVHGQVAALHELLTLRLPKAVKAELRERVASAYHDAAEFDFQRGDLRGAWRAHLASMLSRRGWVYAAFTRHLVVAAWRRLAGGTVTPPATDDGAR